jgi:excinuclease ABC subunit B
VNGRAIFYADRITGSMQRCLDETARRRATQLEHNAAHGIVPRGVEKSVEHVRFVTRVADAREEREEDAPKGRGRGGKTAAKKPAKVAEGAATYDASDPAALVARLEQEMKEAAVALDFEQAARLRDQLFEVKARFGAAAGGSAAGNGGGAARGGSLAGIRAER